MNIDVLRMAVQDTLRVKAAEDGLTVDFIDDRGGFA